jgi:hypothetical protein
VGGGGPRAGTAGINIGRSGSEAHYCVSGVRLFSLILCRSGFHALLRCNPSSLFMLCGCISISMASLMNQEYLQFIDSLYLYMFRAC